MARRVIVDTGPIVAYLHGDDRYHEVAKRFLQSYRGVLLTTWPVVTEAAYLSRSGAGLSNLLKWIERGSLRVECQHAKDAARIEHFRFRYADQQPDLADLSLLALAEQTGVREILTLDERDFRVYRLANGERLRNLLKLGNGGRTRLVEQAKGLYAVQVRRRAVRRISSNRP